MESPTTFCSFWCHLTTLASGSSQEGVMHYFTMTWDDWNPQKERWPSLLWSPPMHVALTLCRALLLISVLQHCPFGLWASLFWYHLPGHHGVWLPSLFVSSRGAGSVTASAKVLKHPWLSVLLGSSERFPDLSWRRLLRPASWGLSLWDSSTHSPSLPRDLETWSSHPCYVTHFPNPLLSLQTPVTKTQLPLGHEGSQFFMVLEARGTVMMVAVSFLRVTNVRVVWCSPVLYFWILVWLTFRIPQWL